MFSKKYWWFLPVTNQYYIRQKWRFEKKNCTLHKTLVDHNQLRGSIINDHSHPLASFELCLTSSSSSLNKKYDKIRPHHCNFFIIFCSLNSHFIHEWMKSPIVILTTGDCRCYEFQTNIDDDNDANCYWRLKMVDDDYKWPWC